MRRTNLRRFFVLRPSFFRAPPSSRFENGANELIKNGLDDNELSVALETSDELERLIRSGLGLADALETMLKKGWINRISGE